MSKRKIVKYLATVLERHGEFEASHTMLIEDDSEAYLKQYAKEWYGSDDDDWDEDMEGYWVQGSMVFPPSVYRGLTQEEVDLYNAAQNLKYNYMGEV